MVSIEIKDADVTGALPVFGGCRATRRLKKRELQKFSKKAQSTTRRNTKK